MTENQVEKALLEAWKNRATDPAAWEQALRDVQTTKPAPPPRPRTPRDVANDQLRRKMRKNLIIGPKEER